MRGAFRNAMRRLTHATRPLALRTAGKQGSANGVICHVGRRSGRSYRTPVVAVARDDGFLIALPYGERTDWLQNVLTAGSGTLVIDGRTHHVDKPEVVPMAEATGAFRPREQRLHKMFRVESALRLHDLGSADTVR